MKPLGAHQAAILFSLFVMSCGGGSSSPTPTAPATPTVPATPTNTWSVAGLIVDTVAGQPVAGAQLAPSWALAPVSSAADGAYSLGAIPTPPFTPYKLTVTNAGFVPREVFVTWERGARTNVTLDIIRDAAPFSMDFYKQLVRGSHDQPGAPFPLLRLKESPKFKAVRPDRFYRRSVIRTPLALLDSAD